jgi:prephenate dehydratase
MRIAYLGPEGTFSHEGLLTVTGDAGHDLVALPTLHDTIMAVHDASVDRAFVPIENSLEGSVNATLDTLAVETEDVRIVGEAVHRVRHCLIAREAVAPEAIETVVSHPQVTAQCARFLRTRLPSAAVVPANSTADAVRQVAESGAAWAALGNRLSASLYGCEVLEDGIEDMPENVTRFVWLARGTAGRASGIAGATWKTSVVFWGAGDDAPGWLVRCLSEFAFRGVNLTMIESRPRKIGFGHYMFFADLEGRDSDAPVAAAIEAVGSQTERLRVLGSYPQAGQ